MFAKFRTGWLVVALLCATVRLSSQSSLQDDIQKANKQFDLYAYNLALSSYEKIHRADPSNAHVLARMADCYFQLNRPEEALPWYERAAGRRSAEPEVWLRYGKALMYVGDYNAAKKQFNLYADANPQTARHFAAMCDYAIDIAGRDPLYVAKNEPMNSAASDYAPAFYNDRIVFSSARTDINRRSTGKSTSDWAGSANNQLFTTRRLTSGQLEKPAFLRSDLQNAYNEGPVSYSGVGNKVAFCRNNFIDGTRQIAEKGLNMSLYTADVDNNGNWVNVQAFPYNGSDFATGFPSLSSDGKTMVYASNQPGGLGGWDLYVSNFTAAGWTMPRNLGAPLNTPGNEVTPFYDGNDLYFSSDWHRGMGGLDVFRAELGKQTVSNVYHLGPGINSPRDDYGFVFNSSQRIGYLSSNRLEGRGNEDIWQIVKKDGGVLPPVFQTPETYNNNRTAEATKLPAGTFERPAVYGETSKRVNSDANTPLHILVVDEDRRPVPYADVDLTQCGFGLARTDEYGMFYFMPLSRGIDCRAVVSKNNYNASAVSLENFGLQNVTLSISTNKQESYTGKVLDSNTNEPLQDATVQFTSVRNGKPAITTTDRNGLYTLYLDSDEIYNITYTRYGYNTATVRNQPDDYRSQRRIAPVLLDRVAYKPERPTASADPETSVLRPVMSNTATKVKPIAVEEKFNGYSIQLAASPDEIQDRELRKYEEFARIGNLYSKEDGNLYKVRLGIYKSKSQAQKALDIVQENPRFKTAFIVEERGAEEDLVVTTPVPDVALRPTEYNTATQAAKNVKPAPAEEEMTAFAVQVAALPANKDVAINEYAGISNLGNVYTKSENNKTKVRLGVWANYEEAEAARLAVTKKGFKDAMVVNEKGSAKEIGAYLIEEEEAAKPAQYATATKGKTAAAAKKPYLVRLAALANPERFEIDKVSDLGDVVARTADNGMTVILVGGYPDIETATIIQNQLRNRGFDGCYVVKDEKGKLTRVK
jgi:Carboxypeptidase regulatory-like domain/WD40-like Beta Propeller Repeat/Tetratricopeptide repeat/SPOR domain